MYLPDQIFCTGHWKKDVYSVKSGYKAICEDARQEEASVSNSVATSGIWSAIWKLNVPGKIKHFLWRACTNSLPTKTNLLRRKIISESLCHQCGKSDEDTKHALWDCEAIKQVWCVDFGWVNRFETEQGNFLDLFDRMVSKSGKAELFAISARHILGPPKQNQTQGASCTAGQD